MTFLIDNWFLWVAALLSGGLLVWPLVSGGGLAGGIQPSAAVQLINREKAVVIDVCSATEFAAAHVAGARHVPLDKLESQLPTVVKNKAQALVLVCASGVRSGRAVALAKKMGYENAHSLAGGLKAWQAENLPVAKA